LAFVVAVVIALLAAVVVVVAVAPQEAVMLLLLLVRPLLQHITESRYSLGAIAANVLEEGLVADAIVKAVDDVPFGDVGDGGTYLEEAASVLAQGLTMILFTLGQVMMCTFLSDRSLEVVNEDPLQVLLGVGGVGSKAL
jgi:hypothetical protein